jgi:phage protein D
MQEVALPASSGTLRQPRLRVLANGAILPSAIAADITSNNHYAADRFRLTAHLTSPEMLSWSATDEVLIDIQIALFGTDWTSLIQGEVDQLQLDPRSGLLHLEGRDLTARFIQARTQETFANRTSSEIAAILAARHGLDTDIATTTTPVGAYWQLEHDRITLDSFGRAITEWDLLVALAGHEGFDVWVSGTTLHFNAPRPSPAPAILRPVATQDGPANVISLQLDRALTLAGDIEVVVKSWNSRQANAFVQTARATRSSGVTGSTKGKPLRYVYVVPNLTPDAALKLAQVRLAELTRHERVIQAQMPGELTLMPRQQIGLEGTATAFDQLYWIDEITRRIDVGSGFTQHLRARNVSQSSSATSPADPADTPSAQGDPWTGF